MYVAPNLGLHIFYSLQGWGQPDVIIAITMSLSFVFVILPHSIVDKPLDKLIIKPNLGIMGYAIHDMAMKQPLVRRPPLNS